MREAAVSTKPLDLNCLLPEASSKDVGSETRPRPAPLAVADRASYLLVDVPIEGAPTRAAFAFFAWRFSFSDLLAAVFELFEPPLSLLAIVAPLETEKPEC